MIDPGSLPEHVVRAAEAAAKKRGMGLPQEVDGSGFYLVTMRAAIAAALDALMDDEPVTVRTTGKHYDFDIVQVDPEDVLDAVLSPSRHSL